MLNGKEEEAPSSFMSSTLARGVCGWCSTAISIMQMKPFPPNSRIHLSIRRRKRKIIAGWRGFVRSVCRRGRLLRIHSPHHHHHPRREYDNYVCATTATQSVQMQINFSNLELRKFAESWWLPIFSLYSYRKSAPPLTDRELVRLTYRYLPDIQWFFYLTAKLSIFTL